MAITQSAETILANLDTIPVMSGQVIYVRDTRDLYFDSLNGTRVRIADVVWLNTEAERVALLSPPEKLYYVRGTQTLWVYSGGWVQLNETASRYMTNISATDWTGNVGNTPPYTYTITEASHGKGQNPVVQCLDGNGSVCWPGVQILTNGNVMLYVNERINVQVVIL